MGQPRIIIVGAGPAGVRSAETLVSAGIVPTLIDEGMYDGGQIYRRQPEGFTRPASALYGTEAERASALHAAFDRLKQHIDYRPRHLAWNVAEGHLHVVCREQSEALPYDALIIASGATDRLFPIKGWDLAGVYTLGAAQIALKAQACTIGSDVAFVGTGPLLQLVARQYVKAGANVVALLDITPLSMQIKALPKLLSRPNVLFKGITLVAALKLSRIPVHRGVMPIEIHGDAESGVAGISVRLASGRSHRFDCNAVGIGFHLRPETQLADLARCEFEFDACTRQFWPRIDENGRTSVRGVYLVGDGVRTQGADGAEISGRIAALSALEDLGFPVAKADVKALQQRRVRMERFRIGIAEAFPWPHHLAHTLPDDAIVCRCEGITAGELRGVATGKGASELNRAKAFSRVGMGRCQARYCGHAAAEIVAHATGLPLEAIGRVRGQAPVKPLPIATRRSEP
jgi:NADPH-dependent 2,4-dienoyl-CoA reductase/sulfur reductase-like enzyme